MSTSFVEKYDCASIGKASSENSRDLVTVCEGRRGPNPREFPKEIHAPCADSNMPQASASSGCLAWRGLGFPEMSGRKLAARVARTCLADRCTPVCLNSWFCGHR